MIRSVKDLYQEIKIRYDLSEIPGQVYSFPGQDVLLRSNSSELIDLLNAVYHRFKSGNVTGREPTALYLLKEGEQFLTVDPGFDSFTCSVSDQVLSFWGAQLMCNHLYRSHLLFLHGSVLERDGKAYIFLGKSNAGKSTTILKLRKERFIFFSDEFAPIDLISGFIHPFPRSCLLRSDGVRLIPELSEGLADLPFFNDYQELNRETGEPIPRFIVIPELIYDRIGANPAPVGGIFFLEKFGSEETMVSPLPAAEGLEKLLDHSVNSRYLSLENQHKALSVITALLKNSPAFSLHPGPLDEDPAIMAETIKKAVDHGQAIQTDDLDLVIQRIIQLAPGAPKNRQESWGEGDLG